MRALIALALAGCAATVPSSSAPAGHRETGAAPDRTDPGYDETVTSQPVAFDIKQEQSKALLGMTIAQARDQLARWGYHGEIEIDQDVETSSVAGCDDDHVCDYDPRDIPRDDPGAGGVVLHTRKPVVIGAPPP